MGGGVSVLNAVVVSFIVENRDGCVPHKSLNSRVQRDERTVNSP